jgi:hypothetical protein
VKSADKLQSKHGAQVEWHWVIWAVFAAAYVAFFISPVFLSAPKMQFFEYIPAMNPIGVDLSQFVAYGRAWASGGAAALQTSLDPYPPVSVVFAAPLGAIPFLSLYRLWAVMTLVCYVVMTWVIPIWVSKPPYIPAAALLIFVTGLFSYGLQFELERGQFNVLAMTAAYAGIWLLHAKPRLRGIGYLLHWLSVQLKVYPIVFVLMLVTNWRDWRNGLRRVVLLLLADVGGFLVLGPMMAMRWLTNVWTHAANPDLAISNHSITALVSRTIRRFDLAGIRGLGGYAVGVEIALDMVVLVCLGILVVRAAKSGTRALDPYLLMACTLAALLVPGTSHDYTLAILAAPVVVLLFRDAQHPLIADSHRRNRNLGAVAVLMSAYVVTLFPYSNKLSPLWNNTAALLLMIAATTYLALARPSPLSDAGTE